jgi:cytidylate kinase
MVHKRSIVINGDLGSGKTTVSVKLAERLGLRRISIGDLYRRMAQERGMTALQLNLHAELDDAVDGYVDRLQREIAASGEQLVVDSRLAWLFFRDAFKVHLITDDDVSARRVLERPSNEVEKYVTLEEAKQRLRSRSDSERARFLTRYGADKRKLRNYDLVCDTTRAAPQEIVDRIVSAFEGTFGRDVLDERPPLLLLDPRRIYPTEDIRGLTGLWDTEYVSEVGRAGLDALEPLGVGLADTRFYVVDGHRRLSAALQNDFALVAARLLAEDTEEVVEGLAARQYFESECQLSMIYDWEEAHKVDLPVPPGFHMLSPPEVASAP